jgi:hypothetical protein
MHSMRQDSAPLILGSQSKTLRQQVASARSDLAADVAVSIDAITA